MVVVVVVVMVVVAFVKSVNKALIISGDEFLKLFKFSITVEAVVVVAFAAAVEIFSAVVDVILFLTVLNGVETVLKSLKNNHNNNNKHHSIYYYYHYYDYFKLLR